MPERTPPLHLHAVKTAVRGSAPSPLQYSFFQALLSMLCFDKSIERKA